jgi:dolichol kinase
MSFPLYKSQKFGNRKVLITEGMVAPFTTNAQWSIVFSFVLVTNYGSVWLVVETHFHSAF